MKKTKRNSILTFIFSLLPGGAEMYMGFMKMGVSLLAIFLLGFLFMSYMRLGDVFILVEILVWIVGFFHARNMAKLTQEELELVEDKLIWDDIMGVEGVKFNNAKAGKWAGIVLVFVGIFTIWEHFSYLMEELFGDILGDWSYSLVYDIPRIAIAIVLVVIGIMLIKGKKARIDGCSNDTEKNA